jgi:anti-sigma regulatory factor (Ser/Thr protein kinase)
LATITADLYPDLDGDQIPHEVLSQLIEEAVVNAIKHGKAKNIHIKAAPTSGAVMVEIYDDGSLNEISKGGGLGSVLFDTFAHDWSLGRAENRTVLKFSLRNLTSANI